MRTRERPTRSRRLTDHAASVPRDGRISVLTAAVAQAVTALVSIGQSLALLVIAGPGADTAAFLGSYTISLPSATLAATIRFPAVPLFARDEARDSPRLTSRIAGLGLALALSMVAIGPLVGLVITRSLPGSSRVVALVTLVCLAVAGTTQIAGAGYAALASAQGKFLNSSLVYALAGVAGLTASCVAIALIGALGAALGVMVTGSLVLAGQMWLAS